MKSVLLVALCLAVATAHIYFQETFDNGNWESRWVKSQVKDADGTSGTWKVTPGKWYNDAKEDQGLQTVQDARFYIASAPTEQFTNKDKDLILQYQVKHEQKIDCGGGYLKLLPKDAFTDATKFSPDSKYNIMFGPDICGTSTRRTHLIFSHDGENHLVRREMDCKTDQLTHLYTLILHPDNTYVVKIDNEEVQKGNLEDDFGMVPAKRIPDPAASKPVDWIDDPEMDDPTDVKPAGWDDIPALIPDPSAKKPEDWDDETDGDWESPMIDNPEYKGVWQAKRIPNPAYKGVWEHPMIDNPEYKANPNLYIFDFAHVGIEIWQVKAGTIFDNIIVTDSIEEANQWAAKYTAMKNGEQSMFEEEESKRREEEEEARKKAEEERKKLEEEEEEDDDDDDYKDEL